MQRIVAVLVLVLGLVSATTPASGQGLVTHFKDSFTFRFRAPAGTLCDFKYHQFGTVVENQTVFGDVNNPTRVIDHQTIFVNHVNVDTGYTLTETDHQTLLFNQNGPTLTVVGVFWHLRDASGNVVLVKAGQVIFDQAGNIVKFTPNSSFDQTFPQVICPALGGNPA